MAAAKATIATIVPRMPASLSEFILKFRLCVAPSYHKAVRKYRRGRYFAAALCLTNAVTTSFCADAMALFAVVICAPASTSGN